MLLDAARRRPGAEALVCGDERLSYADYAACVIALAQEMVADGPVARVALLLRNSCDAAIGILAAQAAGAQVVPLNPDYTHYERGPILADADPGLILHDEAVTGFACGLRAIAVGPATRRLTGLRPTGPAPALPLPGALSTLQYTGGTTGRAKGVNLTHRAVATNVYQRDALLPTAPDRERVLAITPLFHVYAASMCLYLALLCRGTLVILPRYHPGAVLDAIARERITLFSGSPTIFAGLMGFEGFAAADLSSLTSCYSGAAALPQTTLQRWEERTGTVICEGYGQTEAGPVLTYNPRHGLRKAGSVGVALPETEIAITGITDGARLPAGEQGEICARGPQIMSGYRNLPVETAAALQGGWLHTGDIGWLGADGYLHVCDRKKDMAIVSGFNVYPREVEEALHTHPAVAEAAVIGVPDAYRGERLQAYVVLHPRAAAPVDLAGHLAALLVRYKQPHSIEVVDRLPKTVIGKIDKQRLRAGPGSAVGLG